MKNKFGLLVALIIAVIVALGCSSLNPFSGDKPASNISSANRTANANAANKSLSDQAVDTVVGESKIGVQECDSLITELTAFANNPEDNFAIRMAKGLAVNQIKESIRVAVEENQTDKSQLAVACKEIRTEFDKYKSGQPADAKK